MPTPYTRAARQRLIRALGGECADCGSIIGLEIDHKEPLRTGARGRRDESVWKDRENLELRCRPCHQLKTQEDYKRHGWRFGSE